MSEERIRDVRGVYGGFRNDREGDIQEEDICRFFGVFWMWFAAGDMLKVGSGG